MSFISKVSILKAIILQYLRQDLSCIIQKKMDEEICNNMFYLYHYIFVHTILDLVISKGLSLAKYHLFFKQKVVCMLLFNFC